MRRQAGSQGQAGVPASAPASSMAHRPLRESHVLAWCAVGASSLRPPSPAAPVRGLLQGDLLIGYCEYYWCTINNHQPSTASLLFNFYLVFFWLCHVACGILVPGSGIEPGPQQGKR